MKSWSKRQAFCALATIVSLFCCNMERPVMAQAEAAKTAEEMESTVVAVQTVQVGTQAAMPEVEIMTITEELPELTELELLVETEPTEPDPLAGAECLGEFQVTYYCAEPRPHICGTGDGITASGRPLVPYFSAAVDPTVIPLDSQLAIDFGDGELHYYSADDVGSLVEGLHIDLAVEGHEEALSQTQTQATVWILP